MDWIPLAVSTGIAIFGLYKWIKANGVAKFLIRSVEAMNTTEGRDFAQRVKTSIKNKAVAAGFEESLNKMVKKVTEN